MSKQISLDLPDKLLEELEEVKEKRGYLSIQNLIRELVRDSLRRKGVID